MVIKNRGSVIKLTGEDFQNIFKVKVIKKAIKDRESAIVADLKNVLIPSFIKSSHKVGGLYLQITQRFLAVHESNILDLFEIFEEVERQVPIHEDYIHTVNTICINPRSKIKNQNVVSVFDGQHRLVFFTMLILALIKKMSNRDLILNLKEEVKDLMLTLFNQKNIDSDKFVIKYADKENAIALAGFLSDFEEFLFSSNKSSFKSFAENSDNPFSKTFDIVNNSLTRHLKKMNGDNDLDKLRAFYTFLNRRTSVIIRPLQEYETETVVFMDTNKSSIPFYEFEAVKMITTAFISDQNEKFEYATNFNHLLHWVEKEASLTELEIAHVLRFTVLNISKYTKNHISITSKSNREKKLSYVVKTELKSWFSEIDKDSKRYNEFLDIFREYLSAYMSLKKGVVIGANLEGHALNVFKLYSFTFNQSGTSGERFSYLVLEQLRALMFEPFKFSLVEGKRSTKDLNTNLKELYRPVQVFNDLLFLEFSINGKNMLKPYEDKFDRVFVRLIELQLSGIKLSNKEVSKIIESEILNPNIRLTKERLKSNLEIKDDFNHIHTKVGIQRLILLQKEFYLYMSEGVEFHKILEFISSVSNTLTLEHIIPQEATATLVHLDSVLANSIQDCHNYWYLTTLIERDLNLLASNHNLKYKKEIFDNGGMLEKEDRKGEKFLMKIYGSKMIGYEIFTSYDSYEELFQNKEKIKKDTIDLFIDNISFFE